MPAEPSSAPGVAVVDGAVITAAHKPLARLFDLFFATVLLAAAAPVMFVSALAVRLSSPGPIIFRQERVGLRGQPFVVLKFRTMVTDNDDRLHRELCLAQLTGNESEIETSDGVFKLDADDRVTGVGRWLRRTSIDELPQLVNVLKGEMSLVGPRPALAWEAEHFSARHQQRVKVKPGLTGLWQVSGRNRLSMRQAYELDLEYVERRSWAFDLAIMFRTIGVILRGDGAR